MRMTLSGQNEICEGLLHFFTSNCLFCRDGCGRTERNGPWYTSVQTMDWKGKMVPSNKYLQKLRKHSPSVMLKILIDEFLPDKYERYVYVGRYKYENVSLNLETHVSMF